MPIYVHRSALSVPLKDLYDFHLHPNRLSDLNPPCFKIQTFEAPKIMEKGERVHLTLKICGVSQEWLVRFDQIKAPAPSSTKAWFIDTAEKSPFPFQFWQHKHLFEQSSNHATKTFLTDIVDYDLPSPFWGWLLFPFVHVFLFIFFCWRHWKTKKLLLSSSSLH